MFTYSRRATSGVRIESGRQVIHATLTSSMCHPPPFNISELQLDHQHPTLTKTFVCRFMITRNLDQLSGLVNGVQVVCVEVRPHTVTVRLPSGVTQVLPRITYVITPSASGLPFAMTRRQFPLMPSYALTVHRVQGQTLHRLGLYFTGDAFCHGLLFTALSRVRSWANVIAWCDAVAPEEYVLKNLVRSHIVAHLRF
jgi:hypothetical protein